MPIRNSRKLSLIALLVAASAPVWANDAAPTTQQTAVGEAAMEMAASLERISGAQENSAAAHETIVIVAASRRRKHVLEAHESLLRHRLLLRGRPVLLTEPR